MPSPSKEQRTILGACLAPATAFFLAFWLLPMTRLIALPAKEGWEAYFTVLTHSRYLTSLINTLVLSLVVTAVTLVLGATVGLYLAKNKFKGRKVLLALLTMPLSFPGVIVGFFVILLGGRQGPIAALMQELGFGRVTFAYGILGLFLAYLYFSLPRAIINYTAAAEAMEPSLEEAAKTLNASRWHIIRDVWLPQLMPISIASGAIIFATSMGAFGTAFTLSSSIEVLPISIYNEFTNYANFATAASLSIFLGLITWFVLFIARILTEDTSSR